MPIAGKRVTNVLLTCRQNEGIGGVQVVLRELAHGLEQTGRHVYFLYDAPLPSVRLVEAIDRLGRPAFYCPLPAVDRGTVLVRLPIFLAYLPITLFHLIRLMHDKKIGVVNCHYLSTYFIHLVIAARLLHVQVVISVHGADIDAYAQSGWVRRLVCRLIMLGAHQVVACSEALAKQAVELFPNVRDKVTYVHNGLDPSRYVAHEALPLPRPYILCVCRHVHKKGVDTLLRAFALVLRECSTHSLVLVGDGPLLDEHKALARTLDIVSDVVFVGSVAHDDVSPFLSGCTLFVLPSRAEPFGLVLLEAAYHGKAIVCTRVGGVPEIIVDGVNGVMVAPDDPAGMAAQIVGLIGDPRRRELLGAHAYETLMARFLWKDRIHDYITIYEGRSVARLLGTMSDRVPTSNRVSSGQDLSPEDGKEVRGLGN